MLTAIAFAATGRAEVRTEADSKIDSETRLPKLAYLVMDEIEDLGPTAVDEIPYRWPLTRLHLRHIVEELIDTGIAEWVVPAGPPARRLDLTESGRRVLAANRWQVARLR